MFISLIPGVNTSSQVIGMNWFYLLGDIENGKKKKKTRARVGVGEIKKMMIFAAFIIIIIAIINNTLIL